MVDKKKYLIASYVRRGVDVVNLLMMGTDSVVVSRTDGTFYREKEFWQFIAMMESLDFVEVKREYAHRWVFTLKGGVHSG